jgi:hypothetical protein
VGVESLDGRILMAAGFRPLGPFLDPGTVRPRVTSPAPQVDPHPAINQYLAGLLGQAELAALQRQVEERGTSASSLLTQKVLQQPFIHAMFSDRDLYTLLNSPAMQEVIGFDQLSDNAQTEQTVRYTLPQSSILSLGSPDSIVAVPASETAAGFIATVPTANIRVLESGFITADIPRSAIPPNAPAPEVITVVTGALGSVYQTTGPILNNALLTARHRPGPNIARTVPGLRLGRVLQTTRAFPFHAIGRYQRLMRAAVERNVFQPTAEQQDLIQNTLAEFAETVGTLQQQGVFEPSVPPPSPPTVNRALGRTFAVTSGVIRDLVSVAASQAGLPLLGTNFPGRLDVGYIIARNGDYGLILTARGPLQGDPGGISSQDLVGGDLRIEVSSAPSLMALDGQLRTEEGLVVGSALMGTVTSSNSGGIATFGASAGYGSGLAFGTGISYTRVIPLGNINALIPQFPPT